MKEELVGILKVYLADSYALYFKAHGYHWNIEGCNFPQYHQFYGMIAEDAYSAVDPTAEYIRALQAYAPFKMSRFVQMTTIPETEIDSSCEAMNMDLLMATEKIISTVNNAFQIAINSNEQGIGNFLSERDSQHKKFAWQLRSSLKM